ncbi:MAG: hypothetical protein CL609_01970 [Anaerolineaceae bacterium]|nr:hypothetical protein [Anaerolineaceae bacterium]
MIRSTSIKSKLFENFQGWISSNRFPITTIILLIGLISFEMFNYSTTDFALTDLLGDLKFIGIQWSTILAVAFCGIDFAGIARLFMPEEQASEPQELWFLFAAWLLAATMNAILTWWGVSMSLINHTIESSAIIEAAKIQQIVPIFVAIMVWLTRILLIGSLSFSTKVKGFAVSPQKENKNKSYQPQTQYSNNPVRTNIQHNPVQMRSTQRPNTIQPRPSARVVSRPEPEYVSEPGLMHQQAAYSERNSQKVNKRF